MIYKTTLFITKNENQFIDMCLHDCCNQGEDDTIVNTAKFINGMQMDVKCCGSRNDTSWTEAVLFDKQGCEIACSEVCDEYVGEWELKDHDDNTYIANVKVL